MSDIEDAVLIDHGSYYDIDITDSGDILVEGSLDSVIIVSLFAEKRAEEYEIAQPERRSGWIGNINSEHQIGSKIWLYYQSRIDGDAINGIRDEAESALKFLLDDGLLKNIIVDVTIDGDAVLLDVKLFRHNSKVETVVFKLWENTGD